jgi:DivIVA domain-containing protein
MTADGGLSGNEVRQAAFAKARFGSRGYDLQQVDAFMERVANTLDGYGMPLTADEIHNVTFDLSKGLRRGYHQDEVDGMLDIVAQQVRRRSIG